MGSKSNSNASIHALVVADDPFGTTELTRILNGEGHSVDVAVIAEEAMHLIGRCLPGIVFIDASLPEGQAFVFARDLRADEELCQVPIVFFSPGRMSPDEERLARSLGVGESFVTPIQATWFLRLLKRVMMRSPRTEALRAPELANVGIECREPIKAPVADDAPAELIVARVDAWSWQTNAAHRIVSFKTEEDTTATLDFTGSTWLELYSNQFVNPLKWEWFIDTLKGQRPFDHFEHEWIAPDGNTTCLRLSAAPMFDEKQQFCGYSGNAQAISSARLERERGPSANTVPHLVKKEVLVQRFSNAVRGATQCDYIHALCFVKFVLGGQGSPRSREARLEHLLCAHTRSRDCLAMLTRNEYGVLLEHCSERDGEIFAQRLLKAVKHLAVPDNEVVLGVVQIDGSVSVFDELLDEAVQKAQVPTAIQSSQHGEHSAEVMDKLDFARASQQLAEPADMA